MFVNENNGLLSLFCGPGGLDEGFRQASFKTLLAVDLMQDCIDTYKCNHKGVKAFPASVSELSIDLLDKKFGAELRPVGVIGGPPCQSFSNSNVHKKDDDQRSGLPLAYAKLLKGLNARSPISFFVFENVMGLLGKRHSVEYFSFKEAFQDAGFEIAEAVLNAINFGVPQDRKRVFIVGINRRLFPNAVWVPPYPLSSPVISVRDAIFDFPEPTRFEKGIDYKENPFHPNHWCMAPRSRKFFDGSLVPGTSWGRSFRVLEWDKPSWTVAYGNREVHVHPSGKRRLSVYEAMMLQGFPESYRMCGTLSGQIRQVSDAVPPPMARHIAKSILKALRD